MSSYKFQKLSDYFAEEKSDKVTLTYNQMELILGFKLSKSAYEYKPYWNPTKTHTVTKAWIDNGWDIEYIKLGEYVTFYKKEKRSLKVENNRDKESGGGLAKIIGSFFKKDKKSDISTASTTVCERKYILNKVNRAEIENMPEQIMGKSLTTKVIPTVCSVRNMLMKIRELNGDYASLKAWQKRSYKAYNIDDIKLDVLKSEEKELPDIIREHILNGNKTMFGASCIDIYIVAYVANTYGVGKETFKNYIFNNEITKEMGSVDAIWNVGKGDGVYLGILNKDGSIKDHEFIKKWMKR